MLENMMIKTYTSARLSRWVTRPAGFSRFSRFGRKENEMKLLSLFCEIDVMFGFKGTTLYVGPTEDMGIEEGLIIPASELEEILSAIEAFGFDRDLINVEEVDEENDDVYLPDFWLKGE